jgi:capsular exopolysaccharide synthesis family protein
MYERNLKDYWDILKRRRWVVVSFCLISTVAVTIVSLLMTPLYRATTTVVVEGEDANVLGALEAATKNQSFDIFENYLETQMNVILSRSIAGKVFEEFELATHPRYRKRRDPVAAFTKDIYLARVKGTRIIRISVENPDPKRAADIANRLAETYAQDNLMRRALTFIRNQRMASLNSEYLRLQSELDRLSNQYGPKHPAMVALRDEIRMMAKRIENERQRQAQLNDPDASPAEVAENQQLLEGVLLQIQESSVLSSSRMNNINVTDRAVPPKEKAKPQRKLNVMIGFLVGLVGGIFLAFFVDYMDDSVKTDEDLKRFVGNAQFLGAIPLETDGALQKKTSMIDHLLYLRPNTVSAEAYRLVRIGILWFAKKENGFKDFAVLSPRPGEGKTTFASNIAIALAQVKRNVLLVDADIRRGRLDRSYRLPNDRGLGQYLTEDLPLDDIIQKTDVPHLSVVTAGESIINASELFGSPKMSEFIHKTRDKFDMIIYDTPPVTIVSDAAVLISQLNGTLLTVRSGVTSSRIIPKAIATIREYNPKLIGVVLNGAPITEKQYYHRYCKS